MGTKFLEKINVEKTKHMFTLSLRQENNFIVNTDNKIIKIETK